MLNKIIAIGNLTRDVELRYTDSGAAICKFGLAINRAWKDRNTGEKKEEVCYVDVNVFGRSAETVNQFLSKGSKVLVEGRLQLEQWQDQSGQKRSKHSIAAENVQFLDKRGEHQNSPHEEAKRNGYQRQNDLSDIPQGDDDSDSVPF